MWLGTKSGEYSTKSGYYTAVYDEDRRNLPPNAVSFKWKNSVWNLPCAPKVKLFSWKLLKGALPVSERLVERHVPVDPLCKRCGCSESITHLMYQCQFSQRVWQLAPYSIDMDTSGIINLMSSWDALCARKCLPPSGITSGSLAPWIVWTLWKARNKFVFEGYSASPEDTLSSAIKLAREWAMEMKTELATGSRHPPLTGTTTSGAVVIRSDAAWSAHTHDAGLGCIIISDAGTRSFKSPIKYVGSPLAAKGLALREAVRSCVNLGLKTVVFESDSAQLIKTVKTEVCTTELYGILADVHFFASAFDSVSFSWIPREKNVVADCLAKDALAVSRTMVVGDAFIAPN